MITTMWKHVSYRKTGISHEAEGIDCQDSVRIHEDDACIIAALADGLGSLKYSALASMTATATACQWLSLASQEDLMLDTKASEDRFREAFSATVSDAVRKVAESNGIKPKSMDCTLAFVFISKIRDFALAGMIGDSAVCVISKDTSIALADSGSFSNGTRAVQDRDAGEHMLLRRIDLQEDRVVGFILTSDGLDNEIYTKGSTHVNQASEEYFNAMMEPDPAGEIEQIISELTNCEDTPYDDDISIAVVSRAEGKIRLETDPSWLCSCGCRNVLQNTYCVSCNQDFTKLYSNVRFREYGGKAAFFKKINEDPAEERKLIGLPPVENTVSVVAPSEQQEAVDVSLAGGVEEMTNESAEKVCASSSQSGHKSVIFDAKRISKPLALAAAAVLAVGAIAGMIVGRMSAGKKADELMRDILMLRKELVEKEQQIEVLRAQIDDVGLDNFCVLEDGGYYWGQLDGKTPDGTGILLMDGDYFIGEFEDGLHDGLFAVIRDGNPGQIETAIYAMGELQMEPLHQEVQYVVTGDRVDVRNYPGDVGTNVIGIQSVGDIITGTGIIWTVGEDDWAEIQWEGKTAWILMNELRLLEEDVPETIPEGTDPTQVTDPEADVYVVIPQNLNVRNEPGTDGTQIMGELHAGDAVTLTGAEQKIGQSVWVEILFEEGTAWVASSQLKK